ncbi:dienelactone hydrolase family protein [Telmatospirillum sp. J64-1]|uniref:dienelactone hydrolase family protein n=1 Tax=Telmatospirillum sp. J64-1 TaxID=2502183 RepID=UPI00115C8341|nr:dienelactone hydrolase family protein [Telmatospirillum sp. J64-1]
MGHFITLTAADGHQFSAWRAAPKHRPARAGLVLVQEIFGVNAHIRSVAEAFAAKDFAVIAPALFDRVRRDTELGYEAKDIAEGRELRGRLNWEDPLRDIEAARRQIAAETAKVGVVGYCWGGSLSFLSACRLGFDAAVCYYGAQIADFAEEKPNCPVMMHFGERDSSIPAEARDRIRKAQPDAEIHLYDAGHGFNCDMRTDYHPQSAELAMERTLNFFERYLR